MTDTSTRIGSIRPMDAFDLPASSALKSRVFGDLYAGHVSEDRVQQYLDKACSVSALSTRLADPNRRLIVHEVGSEIVGGAILDIKGEVGYLNSVWVAPEYRGQGIGRDLALWRERHAVEAGCERLQLHVWSLNDGGRCFAEARGYERVSQPEELYDELTDSVLHLHERRA